LFPRIAWEQAVKIQKTYNVLYARISNDVDWLGKIMDEYDVLKPGAHCRLVDVDDFVGRLWQLYKEVKKEGIVQVQHTREHRLTAGSITGFIPFRLYDSCGPF